MSLVQYHTATKHSLESVQADRRGLDWANQPLPFKIYTSLPALPLPMTFSRYAAGELDLNMLSRLCYFSNGVTKVIRGMPFRAAACTGALYHVELYLVRDSGVYHYGAHDNALRQLRTGDFRGLFAEFCPAAEVYVVLTSTWWRNAWKYQARAYRHAFWDSGTILANFLAVASAHGVSARVNVGFPDPLVNALLDVDPAHEAAIAIVCVGSATDEPPVMPAVTPLNLAVRALSAREISYPEILQAHTESSLASCEAVRAWLSRYSSSSSVQRPEMPVEDVILRRGSSRRFSHASISLDDLLEAATTPFAMDAFVACDLYLIANAVDGLPSGAYWFDRVSRRPVLLKHGDFRREAAYLDLGQSLAGDAALNAYWLTDSGQLDDRGYRAAQLCTAIEAGQLYLSAYAHGLGATGLTFFDDEVTRFFSPHAAGKSVMFLTAVGHPASS